MAITSVDLFGAGGGGAAVFNTAADSDVSTFTQTGSASADPAITGARTVNVNHNYTVTTQIPSTPNPTINCPWVFNVATGKTLTLINANNALQKFTFSGLINAAGTGAVVIGGAGGSSDSFVALPANSGLRDLRLANNAYLCVEVSTGTLASSGATIRWLGSTQQLRWATGNTTDYSSSAYTKAYALGVTLDPNGQTITFASAWNLTGCSIQIGNAVASLRVNGGRFKFNGNETVGRAFWAVYAGTVMELNGTFTGAFASNTVGSGGGTSIALPAGLEGTGTTAQSWEVGNTSYAYIAGGTAGTNGVLTVENLSFLNTNSELWVYSDGTANLCSKPHANGTCALGNHKVRLRNVMAAGTYTILSSTGTMSGTAPTGASVIENLSGRTVTSLTQVGNTLVLVLT